MAKRNVTLQYFDRPFGLDGTHDVLGPSETPENRQPIMRLGWSQDEAHIDWNSLAQMIEQSSLSDAKFFMDSSFFDRQEIPWKVWEALLTRQIVFTPLVWSELEDWRNRPFANEPIRDALLKLIDAGDSRVEILDTTAWPSNIRENARRYIELLGCRKLIGIGVAQQLRKKRGEEPSHDDVSRELQKIVRDRGIVLARKGLADAEKPNFLADEQLVVCAIVNAILSGRETAILTRDADLIEQFYKALYLLDTDYRSLLIADSYKTAPDNLIVQDVGDDFLSNVFEPTKLLLLPRKFTEWVLPRERNWEVVSCNRLGGHGPHMKISRLSYCAETEMSSVLERGVTDVQGQRIRLCVSPPFAEAIAGHVFIGKEKSVQCGPWQSSAIDLDYALHEVEHFRRARVGPAITEATPSLGIDLASFRLEERLMFSIQPEWFDFDDETLATAIRYAEPSAIIMCDDSVLRSSIADCVSDALIQRRFATTLKVLESVVDSAVPKLQSAIERGQRTLDVFSPTDQDYAHGFGYYLALLAFRKQYGDVIQRQVEREHGRVSPADEWPQIVEHYAGRRGRLIAEEGSRRRTDETLFYSDELLVQGFLSSIGLGVDVVFLTCSPVFMDQFVKLCRFAKEHYLAYRLGHCMSETPASFPTYTVASKNGKTHLECHDLQSGWETAVLPQSPYYLNLHCWLLAPGPRLCTFTFCAERPMYKMLRVKGCTGGLNVNRDDRRNLRVGEVRSGPVAFVTSEEQIPFGHDSLPNDGRLDLRISSMTATDLTHVVNQQEDVRPVWFHDRC